MKGELRKRGGVWWTRIYVRGRRFEQSARTSNEQTARAILSARVEASTDAVSVPDAVKRAVSVLNIYLAAHGSSFVRRRKESEFTRRAVLKLGANSSPEVLELEKLLFLFRIKVRRDRLASRRNFQDGRVARKRPDQPKEIGC